MSLVNAQAGAEATGLERQPGASHYLKGNDPSQWKRDVPLFGKVRYESVYPGIDVVYYGADGKLEYDFVVAPGTDPSQIAIAFSGVDGMRLDDDGNLVLDAKGGQVIQRAPVVYQEIAGERVAVEGSYRLLADNNVGFALGKYDTALPLVIDPIIVYSTYLGGNGNDSIHGHGVDAAGNIYIAGQTDSVDFNLVLGDSEINGGVDAYACRFNPAGRAPYCAYFGGSRNDGAYPLAVSPDGALWVGGYTLSTDFPVVNPVQSTHADAGASVDAFLVRIDPVAAALTFSTYLGGNEYDMIRGIAVDSAGSAYVTGTTFSWSGFPVTSGVIKPVQSGGDAFISKFSANGELLLSTFFGGSERDEGRGIELGSKGEIFVSGTTTSLDFPTVNAQQPIYGGGNGDAFLAKLNPSASKIEFSTYAGGSGEDWAYGIKRDRDGTIVMGAFSFSADYPVLAAAQVIHGGDRDGVLSRYDATGKLLFATYHGGSGMDDLRDIALDPAGNIYFSGYTQSEDFPVTDRSVFGGVQDGVYSKFSRDGKLLESSYLGGATAAEVMHGPVRDMDGALVFSGWTGSSDFPVVAPLQRDHYDGGATADAFLVKVSDAGMKSWHGDFNGDGTDDILWRNNATGAGVIWYSGNASNASS
jgi:hypothetical protein